VALKSLRAKTLTIVGNLRAGEAVLIHFDGVISGACGAAHLLANGVVWAIEYL